jgi:hypothetical protein
VLHEQLLPLLVPLADGSVPLLNSHIPALPTDGSAPRPPPTAAEARLLPAWAADREWLVFRVKSRKFFIAQFFFFFLCQKKK